MKKIITGFAIMLSVVFAGCSSMPTHEQSGAKRTTEFVKPTLSAPSTAVVEDGGIATATVPLGNSTPQALSLTKKSIFFEYDSDVVKEEYRPLVAGHARYLTFDRTKRIIIQGNTDERGSREYNLALGQRRADSVKRMMTMLGARGTQIETVSFGKDKPREQRSNEAAYAENRRADIVYLSE